MEAVILDPSVELLDSRQDRTEHIFDLRSERALVSCASCLRRAMLNSGSYIQRAKLALLAVMMPFSTTLCRALALALRRRERIIHRRARRVRRAAGRRRDRVDGALAVPFVRRQNEGASLDMLHTRKLLLDPLWVHEQIARSAAISQR